MSTERRQDDPLEAVILDLDGVVTQTAAVHAQAWKRVFDEFLERHGTRTGRTFEPFDIETDYRDYVDGKPRYDGVRSFLEARGIELPDGTSHDDPGEKTICGLGNRKNALFHELLDQHGVHVFEDAVAQIRRWREQGLKTAVVSSSRNCRAVLEAAGLAPLFDARVDGLDADELQLAGKPAPDLFLEAARRLQVGPTRAIVVEDARAGVEAGRAGNFAAVIGVARNGNDAALRQHGADRVVHDLQELDGPVVEHSRHHVHQTPSPALDHADRIADRVRQHELALFLDYDGTLTPIVERPEDARLSESMRSLLMRLAECCTVAIISGRDLANVRAMVALDNLVYAGSHGFDIAGPNGLRLEQDEAQAALPALDEAERELSERLADIAGTAVERKRFAIAVHYRRAAERDVERIEAIVDEMRARHPVLRKRGGKKIFELQPDVEWDKGRAVLWLIETLGLNRPGVLPLYVGDDVTDEDAFRALRDRGIGLRVGDSTEPTEARYFLRETGEVRQFLQELLSALSESDTAHEPTGNQ